MLDKLGKAFSLIQKDVTSLRAEIHRVANVRAIVKDGKNGLPGDDGRDGDRGEKGDLGSRGQVGERGRDGRDGAQGTPGGIGVRGQAGEIGPIGPRGVTGPVGAKGPKGETGPIGTKGDPGKDGASITGVVLKKNELFVEIDGTPKSAGKIILPPSTAGAFTPNASGGGRGKGKPTFEKLVVVRTPQQLGVPLRSDVVYFLDGIIDFTGSGEQIEVPVGGLSLRGHSLGVSGLQCDDDNYTLFVSPLGGSGSFSVSDCFIDINGVNSKVHDITDATGGGGFEHIQVNFTNCSSLGEVNGYGQGLEQGTRRFGGRPELTLSGTWAGGYFIDVSIVRNLLDGAYSLYSAGAAFVMNSRFRSNQNIDLPASASFFDFAPSNFPNSSTVQLQACLVSRDGVVDASDANLIPNMAGGDLASEWRFNDGLGNTFVGGELVITGETTSAISTPGVFVDLAGTYAPNDLQHFDEPANGQLRHLGESPIEYAVSGQLVLESGANDEVDLKVVIFRDKTSSFEDGKTLRRVINNLQGGRNVAYFAVSDNIILSKNDFAKLQVANVADTDDVTAELDSFFMLTAR